uniref:Uncharacterized protein n=1 Tax=Myripristis murdjan TaxID=586833 RepID=A0A667X682_9TELE
MHVWQNVWSQGKETGCLKRSKQMEHVRSLLSLCAELLETCAAIAGCRCFSIADGTKKSPSFGFQLFLSGFIPWFNFSKFCR